VERVGTPAIRKGA